MTVAIIVYILIVTVPLIAAAALTEKLFRLWSLPVRAAWAITALLITIIGARTITQQLITPPASISVTGVNFTPAVLSTQTGGTHVALTALSELISLPRTVAARASHLVGPTPDISLAILWLVMSGIMLALICVVYSRVRRAGQAWRVADFAGQRVRVAPNAGPAVVGIFRPEIVVPNWLLDGRPEDSHLIVMHEMEHRAAHDPALLAAMWGLVALFPWHPGAWYCLARTRLAIEIDCDARVVGKGASLRNYAQLLINQARARRGAPMHLWLGATSLLEPSSHLERRLRAMVTQDNETSAKRPFARALRSASYIAIVSTLAIAACESHVPTAADISGLDATSAEQSLDQAFRLVPDTLRSMFYVDGVAVSAERAKAISSDSIATVNFVRSTKPGSDREIRLVTHSGERHGKNSNALGSPADTIVFVAAPYKSSDAHKVMTVSGTRTPLVTRDLRDSTVKGPVKLRLTYREPLTMSGGAEPLFVIDGVVSTAAQFKALNPASIKSVNIMKGPAAAAQYSDPRVVNGVVSITLSH